MYDLALDTFICVADCGSFNKAADKLYLSPTAVMKQMNTLEKRLGIKLFCRTSHGISLTAGGQSIYKDAKSIISASKEAVKRAEIAANAQQRVLRVGTSMLNPCKAFMDIWYKVSERFPNFKIQIIPFEDNHEGILSVIDKIGSSFDFIVGVCDSSQWLERCNMYPLGRYKKCIAVPIYHPLAKKSSLKIADLYGETLMMVKRGDSRINDALRDELEAKHPQIKLEDTYQFYDITVFNRCAESGKLLLNLECWSDIHPSLKTIPVDWSFTIPYGLLYPLDPKEDIAEFLKAISDTSRISS